MKLAYKYRLYPTKEQIKNADNQLFEACMLYNAALQHRVDAYKGIGKNVNYDEQSAELKLIRAENLTSLSNFSCSQNILRRLDKTFKAFFRRLKKKEKPGFPRYKSPKRFNSITYPSYNDGCKLKGNRIYMQGIGDIYIRLHRPVCGLIKTVSLKRENNKFYVIFVCEVDPIKNTVANESAVGIDMGIESFATTSNGEFIKNERHFKTSQSKLRRLQRSMSRKVKGSNGKCRATLLVSKQHDKIRNKRIDFLHKTSSAIVSRYSTIVIEDLNIRGLSKGILAKEVQDVGWGMFFNMLSYKAEKAGKKVIKVNPNGTSQRCNACGREVKKKLSDRWHECECGESVHRDINSAKEILRLGTNPDTLTHPVRELVVS